MILMNVSHVVWQIYWACAFVNYLAEFTAHWANYYLCVTEIILMPSAKLRFGLTIFHNHSLKALWILVLPLFWRYETPILLQIDRGLFKFKGQFGSFL